MSGHPSDPRASTAHDAVKRLSHSLHEINVDSHKVLEQLVVYMERLNDTPAERRRYVKPSVDEMIPELLEEARLHCSEIWKQVFTKPEGYQPPEFKDREMLRHSRRLLNFAAGYVEDLLVKSEQSELEEEQTQFAMQAVRLCEQFVSSLDLPYKEEYDYRHKDAPKWLRLLGQAERRMSELWLNRAKTNEAKAIAHTTTHKLPAKLEDCTWEQVEKLGFRRKALCSDRLHQEVYLPVEWTLERGEDNRGTLLDEQKRVRAEIVFAGDEGPSMKFIWRWHVVEQTSRNCRWFSILDRTCHPNRFHIDSQKIRTDEDPTSLRKAFDEQFEYHVQAYRNPIDWGTH
jgi:hypothetical protein